MINYTTVSNSAKHYKIDKSKRNILLIGKGSTSNKNKIILNPVSDGTAYSIYGDCDLYKAFKIAREITDDSNIYTVNCQLFTDFIEIIDSLIHYNFDFIVPVDVYIRDTFIHPISNKSINFFAYYLERLGITENRTTLIMTDRESHLYESIDHYLVDMDKLYKQVYRNNMEILNKYGNNLVFVLNNLADNKFSHVILAASLSVCNFDEYPKDIVIPTYYDIDYADIRNKSFCFYKHHTAAGTTSVEQLNNMNPVDDVNKKILIDLLVKHVVNKLDFTEFSGVLYNPYIKVQIENKAKRIMQELKRYAFIDYKIKSIQFVKTDIGVGRVLIDVAIVPYSILETINIFMEV